MSAATINRPNVGDLWDDSPRAKRSNPLTSHEAADTNDVVRSIGLVLDILRVRGPLADHEIEEASRERDESFTGQRLRTARAALVAKRLVEYAGFDRLTPHKRRTQVWQVKS